MNSKYIIFVTVLYFFSCLACVYAEDEPKKQLQIGIKKRVVDCKIKSKKGDLLHMHYKVRSSIILGLFFMVKLCN